MQSLAVSQAIYATGAVVDDPDSARLLAAGGLTPRRSALPCAASLPR